MIDMGAVKEFLVSVGVNIASLVAGVAGAALAAVQGNDRTRAERIINFFFGFVAAAWLPGLVIGWLKIPPQAEFYGGLGFVFGYFAMAIADAAKQFDWRGVAERKLKKGG